MDLMRETMTPRTRHDIFIDPYVTGNSLGLTLTSSQEQFVIQVKILKVFGPSTLSSAMQVEVPGYLTGSKDRYTTAVLKLYDWRYANKLRADGGLGVWSELRGSACIDSITSGEASEFLRKLKEVDNFKEPDSPEPAWTTAEVELHSYNVCDQFYSVEVKAYNKLKSLQGKEIPLLYGTVSLALYGTARSDLATPLLLDLLEVKGILIEHIPGPQLYRLPETPTISRNCWQPIFDKAIQIVHKVSDHDIINKDVKSDNIIVSVIKGQGRAADIGSRFRVVMYDFAICDFRREGESDIDWGRKQWRQNEEGKLGNWMKNGLARLGFDLEFKPSNRFIQFAPRKNNE